MDKTADQLKREWAAEAKANTAMPRDEFLRRFKARMVGRAGETFDDGASITEYADETGPSYYDEPDQRREGPEACAEADMSYWGE